MGLSTMDNNHNALLLDLVQLIKYPLKYLIFGCFMRPKVKNPLNFN